MFTDKQSFSDIDFMCNSKNTKTNGKHVFLQFGIFKWWQQTMFYPFCSTQRWFIEKKA